MTSQLRADPSETATRSIQRWVLVCSILASSMAFIDGTALSVVMPALQVSLNATGAGMLWVINGFSLPLAALLLLGGGLGDCFGRKRMFVLGIISFAAASVACGLAGGMPTLIAARVVQGMGGALMIPGSLAMLSTCFSAEERGKAIGTWSAFSVLASAIGPVLGGLLARAGMWRWVFYINLPLAGIVLAVLWLKTPADRKPDHPSQVDWRGALAAAVGLASLNFGLIQWPRIGLAHFGVIAALVTGVASLMLFVFIERRATLPLLPLGVFKSRTLQGASVLSLLFFMAFHGMLFFLPLNLIQVQGYDPAMAGLTQLPLMSMLILLSRWAGKLVDRRGPRLPLTVGPSVAGFGFLFFAGPGVTAGPHEFWFSFLPGLLLVGVGLGLTAAPLSTTVMSSVSDEKLGLASGINSSLTRLAGVLAIAVMGAVMLASFDHFLEIRAARLELPTEASVQLQREAPKLAEAQVPPGLSPLAGAAVKQTIREAFVDAFRVVAILAAGLSWLGALVAARLLNAHTPSPPSQNGDGVSERFATGAGNPDESAPPVKRASE
jgi:EmrB/QacA subfamily drug resistance transporter